MKELLGVLFSFVLVNNVVLTKAFGVSATINAANNKKLLSTGLYIGATMIVSTIVCWALSTYALAKLSLGYLAIFVNVVVVALVALLFKAILKKDKVEYALTICNSAVLGLCLLNASADYGFMQLLFAAVGAAVGLLVAMFMFAAVKSRINQKYVAESFKGLPIEILAAGIIALEMSAFK